MPAANDLRKGMAIKYNGNTAIVLEVHHRTPGNLGGPGLGQRAHSGRRIAPVTAVLPRVAASVAGDAGGVGGWHAVGNGVVVARVLAGIR